MRSIRRPRRNEFHNFRVTSKNPAGHRVLPIRQAGPLEFGSKRVLVGLAEAILGTSHPHSSPGDGLVEAPNLHWFWLGPMEGLR